MRIRLLKSPVIPVVAGFGLIAFLWSRAPATGYRFAYIIIAAVWLGLIWSAATGYVYTGNFRMERTPENRKEFWQVWVVMLGACIVVTYVVLQLPF